MTVFTIPPFVPAGLANVSPGGDVTYRTEADLRDTLAMTWWLAGAPSVRTEVKVPDCGRIDVLVDLGSMRFLYEVKRRIETSTQARQAFQQAHAYEAYLTASGDRTIRTEVVAAHYSVAAAATASAAYPYIDGGYYADALAEVRWYRSQDRLPFAEQRSVALGRLAEMARDEYTSDASDRTRTRSSQS